MLLETLLGRCAAVLGAALVGLAGVEAVHRFTTAAHSWAHHINSAIAVAN